MPAPRRASPLKTPSPVPTHMRSGFAGSITIDTTARFGDKSLIGLQLEPASVLFHRPPSTPAMNIVFGLPGWKRSTRVRPPTLPGPSGVHVPSCCSCDGDAAGARVLLRAVEYQGRFAACLMAATYNCESSA